MRAVIDACFTRPGAVLVTLMLIFAMGIMAYIQIPKEAAPDISVPVAYVSVSYNGISPEDAEKLLVKPLEKELRKVAGLDTMTAVASEGYASVTLKFFAGEDVDLVLEDVRTAVDDAKPELPAKADEPKVKETALALNPILTVAIHGPVSERTLVQAAQDLQDEIEAIPGVLEVEIGGDRKEMVEIIIDIDALEPYGIDAGLVISQISANNRLVTAGAIETAAGRMLVKVPGVVDDLKDLKEMPIKVADGRTIKFEDIAVIRRTFKDAKGWSRVNGQRAVVVNVKKRVGANIIEVVTASRSVIDARVAEIPGDVEVSYLFDESETVRNLLSDLGNNVIAAILIVMIVIVATLGLRNAALIGLAIPSSFLLGLSVLHSFGVTMNIVVLFSLILVAGMLVDGVIVTTELADRRLAQGASRRQAYRDGAVRMAWPIISSTVTTLMVFVPLLFWPGVIGGFMKYVPITVICVLTASLFMALIFVPIVASFIGKKSVNIADRSAPAPRFYRAILKQAVRFPFLVVLVISAFMVFSYFYYKQSNLGQVFFPKIEPDQAVVQILARGDLSATEKDRLVREAEDRLVGLGGVKANNAQSGASDDGEGPKDSVGTIRTVFTDWSIRDKAALIIEDMRARLSGIPGAKVTVKVQQQGPGSASPISIDVLSDDLQLLTRATAELRQRMEAMGGFVDIADTRALPGTEWAIDIDRDAANRHGVSIGAVGNVVKLLTNGVNIADFRPDDTDDEIDIVLRVLQGQRSLSRLQELRIPTASGAYVPLSVFATITPMQRSGDIQRKDGKRYYNLTSDVEKGLFPADLLEELQAELAIDPLPIGVQLLFGGDNEDMAVTIAFLIKAFSISMVMMVIVLMIQFNSLWQTIVTMSAIILSSIGVLLALTLMGKPFGVVMSGLGIIALAGIVVNNNIVLIDTYNEYRARGYDARVSAFRAGMTRFRPVLLTAITTVLGLVPMVFEMTIIFADRSLSFGAPSSQWWTDLASTIAVGVTFATALTLLVTPAMLVLGDDVGGFVQRAFAEIFKRRSNDPALASTAIASATIATE